ncbi:MAG: S8 family serine peptidase [Chlorobi bacterium]|nr:S8 family serine peptidase [Chlorobiota bacterium]
MKWVFLAILWLGTHIYATGQQSWLIWTKKPLSDTDIKHFQTFFPEPAEIERIGQTFTIYRLTAPQSSLSKLEILSLLRQNELIFAFSPDIKVALRTNGTNDPELSNQWHLQNFQYAIRAISAWDTMRTIMRPDTFVIAIIDAGFDTSHQDILFAFNWADTVDGIDNDGNGFVDDFRGWNFELNSPGISSHWHGTLVAGIAGAKTDNGIGVAAPPLNIARILPVVVGNPYNDSVLLSRVVQAYDYVYTLRLMWDTSGGTVGLPIVATNISMGIDGANPNDYPLWCQMYDSLGKLGILSVAATSNNIVNVDLVGDMPTTCPSQWLISVTGTDQNGNLIGAYGETHIDIAAPGTGIYSTWLGNTYSSSSGTSFAAPQVAAMIPVALSLVPDSIYNAYWTDPEIYSLLLKRFILKTITRYADSKPTQTNGIVNMDWLVKVSARADTTIVGLQLPEFTYRNVPQVSFTIDGKMLSSYDKYHISKPVIIIENREKRLIMPQRTH